MLTVSGKNFYDPNCGAHPWKYLFFDAHETRMFTEIMTLNKIRSTIILLGCFFECYVWPK